MSSIASRARGLNATVVLPTFHAGQVAAFRTGIGRRRMQIRCGRRWGKTEFAAALAADSAIRGQPVGWFAPSYKFTSEAYNAIRDILAPVEAGSSKVEGVIRTVTGGRLDVWSLENDRAGRSRKYSRVIVDEAAFAKDNFEDVWERAIEPTLLDYDGDAWMLSNTNGISNDNFFYKIDQQAQKLGFRTYHAPSWQNPHVPLRRPAETGESWLARRNEAFRTLKRRKAPLVFRQEYMAEFVDWSGEAFFDVSKLLVDGLGVEVPAGVDSVFAVIDTAVKDGSQNDGTAVSFWAASSRVGYPLVCLGWEILQIKGALLEQWLPTVFERLEYWSRRCRAMYGVRGTFIEDSNAGSILLQQCEVRGWQAEALPEKLFSAGKDGRALATVSPVWRGDVKITEEARAHTSVFKGVSRNHMMDQVANFRLGDKDAAKRSDDLFDTFCYAIAVTFGDDEGIA